MKGNHTMRIHLFNLLLSCAALSGVMVLSSRSYAGDEAPRRPLTIADAVQMTTIAAPSAGLSAYSSQEFHFSPDKSKFFYVTEQSDLSTNQNVYRLVVVDEETVQAVLSGATAPIGPGAADAVIRTSLSKVAFEQPVWAADGASIHFIGWFGDARKDGQLFSLNTQTSDIEQLTFHDAPVETFALNPVDGSVLFTSMDREPLTFLHDGVELADAYHLDVAVTGLRNTSKPALYIQRKTDSSPEKVIGFPETGAEAFYLDISPNGRYAVFLKMLADVPAAWADRFPFLKGDFLANRINAFDPNTMSAQRSSVRQYQLLDLTDMTVRPLHNAPAGLHLAGSSSKVHWRDNGDSVIIASVAKPAPRRGPANAQHETSFAIIELDLGTDRASTIAEHALYPHYRSSSSKSEADRQARYYKSSTLLTDDLLRVAWRGAGGEGDTLYRRTGDVWSLVEPEKALEGVAEDAPPFEVAITQSMDTRPEISVRTDLNGAFVEITDLNPAFDEIQFGRAEILEWTDANGRAWTGGLIYPTGFQEGKSYPLVIQSHSFHRDDYLLGGPYSLKGPFAAQSLAAEGFFVLQTGHAPGHAQDADQRAADQAGIEAAIQALSRRGLVDADKLGMIGWSSSGAQLQQMALCSQFDFSAMTIADSYNYGLFGYAIQFGASSPGMSRIEGMARGKPWGDSLASWVRSNPELHMDRWGAPLRYEHYPPYMSSWWGVYTILKRQGKPVEYILFRDASHQLRKPSHRFASMQGNVDWFSYWLTGERDPDPQKAAQYARWDQLRDQQAQSVKESKKARSKENGELTYNCGG